MDRVVAGQNPTHSSDQGSNEVVWRKLLLEGHQPLRLSHRLFRHLPRPPRCKLCHNPFGGIGGRLFGLMRFTPSRKNPNLCSKCCDTLPRGGLEVDIAVLFADVRRSTALGEQLAPAAFAALLNRFYHAATETLIRYDAIIDKMIGDEVMALFIPGFCGPQYRRKAAEASVALLKAMGYGQPAEPWLPLGAGVNSGIAYVGNVGGEGTMDFTALGDVVNTASRMQSAAMVGEVVLSEPVYAEVANEFPDVAKPRAEFARQGNDSRSARSESLKRHLGTHRPITTHRVLEFFYSHLPAR